MQTVLELLIQSSLVPRLLKTNNNMAEASSVTTISASQAREADKPKYDNFYTPQNDQLYKTFTYQPLDMEEKEIRLIRLMPNIGDGQIKCELVDNVPLAQYNTNNTALSYCAGAPRNNATILINNNLFNVFANLNHALREVRSYWHRKNHGHQFLQNLDRWKQELVAYRLSS